MPVGCGQPTLRVDRRHDRRDGRVSDRGVDDRGSELDRRSWTRARPGRADRGVRRPRDRDRGPRLRRRGRVAVVGDLVGRRHPGALDGDPAAPASGFAWAGSLDDDVVAAPCAEARDNARFATPDQTWRSPSPTAWQPSSSTSGTTRWRSPDRRQDRAWPSSSSARRGPPTRGSARCPRPTTATAGRGGAGLDDRHPRPQPPDDRRTSRSAAIAGEGSRHPDRLRLQRRPGPRRPRRSSGRRDDAVDRAVRMLGATKARRVAARSSSTPAWSRRCSPSSRSALSGEAVVKGRSFFAGRVGRDGGVPRR